MVTGQLDVREAAARLPELPDDDGPEAIADEPDEKSEDGSDPDAAETEAS